MGQPLAGSPGPARRPRVAARAAAVTAAALAVLAGPALSADQTVSIANNRYTPSEVTINQNEKVTWRFDGPDTNHSVTSDPPGQAESFDSDPGRNPSSADHPPGSTFSHTFTRTGSFTYYCKVHPNMRGRVNVTAPGQAPPPGGEPRPGQPPAGSTGDDPPRIGSVRVRPPSLCARRTRRCRTVAGRLRFRLSEDASVRARIELVRPARRAATGSARLVRSLSFAAEAGSDSVRLSGRGLRAGRYRAVLVATDGAGNRSAPARTHFNVRSG